MIIVKFSKGFDERDCVALIIREKLDREILDERLDDGEEN